MNAEFNEVMLQKIIIGLDMALDGINTFEKVGVATSTTMDSKEDLRLLSAIIKLRNAKPTLEGLRARADGALVACQVREVQSNVDTATRASAKEPNASQADSRTNPGDSQRSASGNILRLPAVARK